MNAARRQEIENARHLIEVAKEQVDQAREMLESAQSDEQEYYDSMPESFQNGEKGEKAQRAVDALANVVDGLQQFVDLDLGDLDTAVE